MKIYNENPIPEILNSWEWQILNGRNLISHIAVRNYLIVKEISGIKRIGNTQIKELSEKYKLAEDSIKKIIYKERKEIIFE